MSEYPKVGVAAIITKGKKVLLNKRINAHGNNTWSFIGGHLEFGESIEQGVKREVFEEVGVKIKIKKIVGVTNDIFKKENKHYITIYVSAKIIKGTPKILEPDRMIDLKWFDWNKPPKPLFLCVKNFRKQKINLFK
ncbi:MAG TPA: NUDIX domain-containing protein [Candidatus Saccharimonadales bacterium]|nr:NUDIX domain-containing protein [Candidatus Saccharimonadales bacterium]